MRIILPATVLATAALSVPAVAGAAATPASLPAVKRTLTAATTSQSCAKTADTVYRAPISGFLDVRLRAARGDWDLGLRDAASRASMGSSRSFGGREVMQAWVTAGQRILVQGCRRSGGSRSAKVSLTLVDVKPPTSGVSQLLRVTAAPKQLEKLEMLGLDVTHNIHKGYGDVVVHSAADTKLISSLGLTSKVLSADLAERSRQSRAADARFAQRVGRAGSTVPSGRTSYRDYPVIQEELKKLVADHPDMVRPVVIGKTFQGRDIQGVEIAKDVNADDGRPVYFLMGVHHAREWAAAEAPMEYAHVLTEQGSDARVANLLKAERTVIVPVVNVDGYVSSRNAEPYDPFLFARDNLGDDPAGGGLPFSTVASILPPGGVFTYRRKNCDGAFNNPMFPCELQYGVDNNRNYGNLWGGPGASPDPTSQSYHGPGPRSEPETQAVWNYTRTHQVSMLMTMHNVAALVLRPPGLRQFGFAPDEKRMKQIGDAMAGVTKYESQYSFQLYDTAGTTEDDTYAATGGYGYTVEIGPKDGEFHAPYETGFVKQWDGTYAEQPGKGLRELLLIAAEAGASTPDHAVVGGTAAPGTTLRLTKDFDTKTSRWCNPGLDPVVSVAGDSLLCPAGDNDPITLKDSLDSTTTVPASGRFQWHVNPSTRPFIGGGAVKESYGPIAGSKQTQSGAPGGVGDQVDHEFTVPGDIGAEALTFDLKASLPEDYDIEVFRKEADGKLTSLGTSGNSPGEDESVTASPAGGGVYVVRVTYFAAITGNYKVSVEASKLTSETTTGTKESYKLTCERDGKVVETHTLTIDRGQAVALRLCGGAPLTGPPAGTPNGPPAGTPNGPPAGTPNGGSSAGTPSGPPAGTPNGGSSAGTPNGGSSSGTPAVDGKPVANVAVQSSGNGSASKPQTAAQKKAAAKKKALAKKRAAAKRKAAAKKKAAAKRRYQQRCVAKAKKIKSSSKRRAAIKRCGKR